MSTAESWDSSVKARVDSKSMTGLRARRLNISGLHKDRGPGAVKRLFLQVRESTSETGGDPARSWVVRYVSPVHGRSRTMGIGSFSDVSLAKARDVARDAGSKIAAGLDPIDERE